MADVKLTEHLDVIWKLVHNGAAPAKVRVHIELIRDQVEAVANSVKNLKSKHRKEKAQIAEAKAKIENENTNLVAANKKIISDNTKLIEENKTLIADNTKLIEENKKLITENQRLAAENERMVREEYGPPPSKRRKGTIF